ncbi:DUF6624 domain-containing protein [Rhizosphaericola mali]|uniref:Uncharacterized protein n=1 Tax=Rhizosphaericola mali TaxID=2545455 RepID=A0A5P2FVT9_9BACT|nr:DUF6624 domain-containing protein [Rhizosphaericola mali]QES87624.1 hypothetical protein E0W69_002715 [Rhizosphaericola mali]
MKTIYMILKKGKLFVVFFSFITILNLQGQTIKRINQFYYSVQKADSLYKSKNYIAAADINISEYYWLKSIGQLEKTNEFFSVPYDALCNLSLGNKNDSAFKLLKELIQYDNFPYMSSLLTDNDLNDLRKDKKWKEIYGSQIENIINTQNQKINKQLIGKLDSIREKDQKPRFQYMDTIKKYGVKSIQANFLGKQILKQDSLNLIALLSLIDSNGWPSKVEVGEKGEQTIFLVIQHAPLDVQEKYLPIMEKAAFNGDIKKSQLAYLQDRVLWRKRSLQLYGSQIKIDEHGKALYPFPMEDPLNVNLRRFSVGLFSMEEYMSKNGGEWDAKNYIKILPELIDNLKRK